MPGRPTYRHVVVERRVPAGREQVWAAVLDVLARAGHPTELDGDAPIGLDGFDLDVVTVSHEPPWRLVSQVTAGAPAAFCQGTVVVVGDGDRGCILAWAALVEPLPGGGSDAFVAHLEKALPVAADRVVAAAG